MPESGDHKLAWTRIPRIPQPAVCQQMSEDGCGVACAQMLLADRGVHASQEDIGFGVVQPTDAPALARRMNELSTRRWEGGALAAAPTGALVHALCRTGTWAALLEPGGFRRVGHWVVVDGVGDEAVVLVRDPVGDAYGVPMTEFFDLWHFTVLVLER